LYFEESIFEVHERVYSIEQFHEELIKILYYRGALLSVGMHRAFGAYAGLENEWSKGCFTLIKMAWDPNDGRFPHDRTKQRLGMTQWHIWDLGVVCSNCLGQLIEKVLV